MSGIERDNPGFRSHLENIVGQQSEKGKSKDRKASDQDIPKPVTNTDTSSRPHLRHMLYNRVVNRSTYSNEQWEADKQKRKEMKAAEKALKKEKKQTPQPPATRNLKSSTSTSSTSSTPVTSSTSISSTTSTSRSRPEATSSSPSGSAKLKSRIQKLESAKSKIEEKASDTFDFLQDVYNSNPDAKHIGPSLYERYRLVGGDESKLRDSVLSSSKSLTLTQRLEMKTLFKKLDDFYQAYESAFDSSNLSSQSGAPKDFLNPDILREYQLTSDIQSIKQELEKKIIAVLFLGQEDHPTPNITTDSEDDKVNAVRTIACLVVPFLGQ